jgi:integrase
VEQKSLFPRKVMFENGFLTVSFTTSPMLGGVVSSQACRTFAEIVEEFLDARARRGVSGHYFKNLGYVLRRAARQLPPSLPAMTAADFEDHLWSIANAGPRTRNNVLGILRQVVRFAQRRGYVSRDWIALDAVEREIEPPSPASLYTPGELRRLLAVTGPRVRPVIVLTALCGVRSAEACRLAWRRDVTHRGATVGAQAAKTRSRRVCPACDSAVAWLSRDMPENGCPAVYGGDVKSFHKALGRCLDRAGVTRRRNGLRHSFISYRLALGDLSAAAVALVAGTSEAMVFANYRELAGGEAAREWFEVKPEGPQLNLPLAA